MTLETNGSPRKKHFLLRPRTTTAVGPTVPTGLTSYRRVSDSATQNRALPGARITHLLAQASGPGEINVNCSSLGLLVCFDLPSPNYGTQVDDFLNNGSPISANDLFVFWGGHNDISTGVDPRIAADNLTQHLTTLLDHGATDIVFLRLFETAGQNARLNGIIAPNLETLRQQYPQATLVDVDIPSMVNEFLQHPEKWGISDYDTPALNTATLEVADEPEKYLLWDGDHLTSEFNKVIADYVLQAMDPALIRQGDFDGDDALTSDDIDVLAAAVRAPEVDLQFDLNFDGTVDSADHRQWVGSFKGTYYGDANLDGEFNSGDLISAIATGAYESDVEVGWASGDFDGSGRFDSGDLVLALADGGYERGPRTAAAVPEPNAIVLLLAAVDWLGRLVRRKRARVDSAALL